MMLSPFSVNRYQSSVDGPTLLILGRVHGDEPCGEGAIKLILNQLESGEVRLLRGAIVAIPIVNPLASLLGERFIDSDLNRIFGESSNQHSYEHSLKSIVDLHIRQATYLLDLHSVNCSAPPFVFCEEGDPNSLKFANMINIGPVISGWENCQDGRYSTSSGTIGRHASKIGCVSATVECGEHSSSEAVATGYKAIYNALASLEMIVGDFKEKSQRVELCLRWALFSEKNIKFVRPWDNMDYVEEGATLAVDSSGEVFSAPVGGYIFLPAAHSPANLPKMYIAERVVN